MRLAILTGASGSGKTTIAEAIRVERADLIDVLHVDRIGVPSVEAMTAGWGSPDAWQRAMTLDWMRRIAAMGSAAGPVLLEGQMRLAFLQEALRAAGIADARIVLVDRDEATRTRRLAVSRGQSELASPDIMACAALLRREAQAAGCAILDTQARRSRTASSGLPDL